MLSIIDTLGGEAIVFHYMDSEADKREIASFVRSHSALGIDTESTHFNCYRPGWKLRSVQIGDAGTAYVIPAKHKRFISWIIAQPMNWIGHNGTHDIRSIDAWLGQDTGVVCAGETYFPGHYIDSRKQEEGGTGHGLKDLAIAYIARDAGKWEYELKLAFKDILIPIPGELYKSGPRKGTQKFRKAKIDEGWGLIPKDHPDYIRYSGADPILTYRLWRYFQPVIRENLELYHFDHSLQLAADRLQRRAMKVDVHYTERLSSAYLIKAMEFMDRAARLGVKNINSGPQIADALLMLGAILKERTPTGKFKTDDKILRALANDAEGDVKELIHCILSAKQMLKRRENYTEAFLREMDNAGRVHPSINTLAARTARMSVSNPPLQQLPTKDREDDADD